MSYESNTPSNQYVYFPACRNGSAGRDDVMITHTRPTLFGPPVVQQDDYYPFGLTFNSQMRSGEKANDFLYNGKERQDELDIGWMDYGARMYDGSIGRFFTQDRFAEKYLDFNPYQYGANNPIRYVDVNGDSIWIANGTLYMTGAVYDATLDHDARKLAAELSKSLTSRLVAAFNEAGIDLKVNIELTGVASLNDVKSSDNLFAIVNEGEAGLESGDGGSVARYIFKNGTIKYGNTAIINGDTPEKLINTLVHEGGHMLGLDHETNKSGNIVYGGSDNPMSYTGLAAYFFGSFGDSRDGNFNAQQAITIQNSVNDKRLNYVNKAERERRASIPQRARSFLNYQRTPGAINGVNYIGVPRY